MNDSQAADEQPRGDFPPQKGSPTSLPPWDRTTARPCINLYGRLAGAPTVTFDSVCSPLPYLMLRPGADLLGGVMESAFGLWVGRPVVLRVALGDCKVGVRGTLLKDGTETLKMRVAEGFDIDIYKEMVLAVEEERQHLFLLS
jgi:hypothetical protein